MAFELAKELIREGKTGGYDRVAFDRVMDDNHTEAMVAGWGLVITSVIGTVWFLKRVVKGGVKAYRFLKR